MSTKSTFISYARTDVEFVEKLATDLRKSGADIWIDRLDIAAGARWDQEIEKALHIAQSLIVVLSPDSVESNNVIDEASYAMEENMVVIPIMIQECKVPFRLRRLQRIDFTNDYDTALKKLAKALDKIKKGKYKQAVAGTEPEAKIENKEATEEKVPTKTPPPPAKKSSRKPIIAIGAVVLLALIGSGGYFFLPDLLSSGSTSETMTSTNQPDGDNSGEVIAATPGAAEEKTLDPADEGGAITQAVNAGDTNESDDEEQPLVTPREKGLMGFIDLQNEYEAGNTDNAVLLSKFYDLKNTSGSVLDQAKNRDIDDMIASLISSSRALSDLQSQDGSDQITVGKKHQLWSDGLNNLTYSGDRSVGENKVQEYQTIMDSWGRILDEEKDFVVCHQVSNRNPSGIRSRFSKGSVFAWARIVSPKNESLRLEWRNVDSNTILSSPTFSISPNPNGYRTWKGRNFQESGNYEVRLYNSQNHLIGRKEFSVN